MLNWNYLETFAILSENLSFSQTARVLNTAQPVVSRQIKVLEHSLGYPLFIRSKKKVALSEQGKLLKQRLRPLIDEMKRVLFEQEIGNEAAGVIRMASMFEAGQLLLFPRLKEILEDHPKLQLHFTLMPSLNINEAVLAGLLVSPIVWVNESRFFPGR